MEITINYYGQAVSVEVYEYLTQALYAADRYKTGGLKPPVEVSHCKLSARNCLPQSTVFLFLR